VKQIVQKYCVNPETNEGDLFGSDEIENASNSMPF
jgi:hypothetical protein